MSILNTIGKNHEASEICHIQCGPFSKQQKLLEHSLLESTLAFVSNVCRRHYHHGKALHTVAHLGGENFTGSSGWINTFKGRHNIVHRTGVLIQKLFMNGETTNSSWILNNMTSVTCNADKKMFTFQFKANKRFSYCKDLYKIKTTGYSAP